jgi:hypothetical protein
MISKTNHDIKHRKEPNNEFYTPRELAKMLFSFVPIVYGDTIMDNAYGTGKFYFKGLKSKDFFNDNRKVDWYITNPPYSDLDKWLIKSSNARKGFAYLLGINNLTAKRIEDCEKRGFYITHIHLCKVFKWFGMSAFVIWEKNKKGIIGYDRTVWK